jgi:hypothetical protein
MKEAVMTVFHADGYLYQWAFGEYVEVYDSYESFDRGDHAVDCINVWDHNKWQPMNAQRVLDEINRDAEGRTAYGEAM